MKLYKVSEAAEITGLSVATWRSYVLRQKVSVVRLGRAVRISQTEIDRLIAEGTSPARTELVSFRAKRLR